MATQQRMVRSASLDVLREVEAMEERGFHEAHDAKGAVVMAMELLGWQYRQEKLGLLRSDVVNLAAKALLVIAACDRELDAEEGR